MQRSLFDEEAMPAPQLGDGKNEVGQQIVGMADEGRKDVLDEAERRREYLVGLTNVAIMRV